MGIVCKQCGARDVEPERELYATPVCFACLPPPKPLPKVYTESHVEDLRTALATAERELAALRAENARLRAVVAKADAVITPGLRYRLARTELEPKARFYCEARAALDAKSEGE